MSRADRGRTRKQSPSGQVMEMKLRSGRVPLRLALCGVLVSGVLAGSAAPVSAACETIWVKAYDVELEIERKVYRVGDTARVEGTVTRKDTGAPVASAKFWAALLFEDSMVLDSDETNSGGAAETHLKLKKNYVELGPARLLALAYFRVADAQCAAVVEYGEKRLRKAFTIKP